MLAADVMNGQETAAKKADLASSSGAIVAGIAIGALIGEQPPAIPAALFATGAGLHVAGMATRHRLERLTGAASPAWSAPLYWLCWAVGAAMLVRAFA